MRLAKGKRGVASPNLTLFYLSTFSSHKCFLMEAEAILVSMTYSCSKMIDLDNQWNAKLLTPSAWHTCTIDTDGLKQQDWPQGGSARCQDGSVTAMLTFKGSYNHISDWVKVSVYPSSWLHKRFVKFSRHKSMSFSDQEVGKSYACGISKLKSTLKITGRYKEFRNNQEQMRMLEENKADFSKSELLRHYS